MELFHRIDDAQAILRVKGGTFKQAEMYRRAGMLYVKASGGFVRVAAKFGDTWGTSNPAITVVDMPKSIQMEYKL